MRVLGSGSRIVRSALALAGLVASLGGSAAAAAEHPDFTGVWGIHREPGQSGRIRRGVPEDLPLRPEARRLVAEYQALVEPTGDSPGGWCLGSGMPGSMLGSGGYPMEIVQHEGLILVLYEAHAEIRHIYITEHPVAEEDLFPDRNGYSVGRWEAGKLIVETTHLKQAVDQRRYPHSDSATIREEYELTTGEDGGKVLVASMTMTDPVFYTEPVRAVKKWSALPGVRLLPYECNEPAWEEHLQSLRERTSGEVVE